MLCVDFRIGICSALGVSTSLFLYQIFCDRDAALLRLRGHGKGSPIQMKGVLRYIWALYSLIIFIGSVDHSGVFGIIPLEVLILKTAIVTFLSSSVLGFAFSRALITAFPFILYVACCILRILRLTIDAPKKEDFRSFRQKKGLPIIMFFYFLVRSVDWDTHACTLYCLQVHVYI